MKAKVLQNLQHYGSYQEGDFIDLPEDDIKKLADKGLVKVVTNVKNEKDIKPEDKKKKA